MQSINQSFHRSINQSKRENKHNTTNKLLGIDPTRFEDSKTTMTRKMNYKTNQQYRREIREIDKEKNKKKKS